MIEKLTHVPIVVSDQEKALKFYTEVLGFEKRADYQNPGSPRWLTVAPKGTDVEMILFEGKYKLDPRAPPEAGSGGDHRVLKTNDCRKDAENPKAPGPKFQEPPTAEGKDGNPLNEVRILCNSILLNQGRLQVDRLPGWPNSTSTGMELPPEKSVLKLKVGEEVRLNESDFVRLSKAFFAELEKKFG